MLFSKNDKKKQEPKKQSTLGFLFNPHIGNDIRPVFESAGMFVRMLALILASYRLFPKNHPAFNDSKLRLTFVEVVATSFRSLSFTRQGIPQILAFVAVFGCILFTALFLVTLLLSVLSGQAHAQLFDGHANARHDWGRQWIDYLFLGTKMEGVAASGLTPPDGHDYQSAMGAALSLYSTAILALAGFLLIYHLTFMIAETAHTGKPMGRANQIWAPIRLVFAIGMLVPIGTGGGDSGTVTGYNTAQYMGMQIARWGSGLASNVWHQFLTTMQSASSVGCTSAGSPSCLKAQKLAPSIVRGLISIDACARIVNWYTDDSHITERNDEFVTAMGFTVKPDTTKMYLIPNFSNLSTFIGDTDATGRHYLGMMLLNEMQIDKANVEHLCGGYEVMPRPSGSYKLLYDAQFATFKSAMSLVDAFVVQTMADSVSNAPPTKLTREQKGVLLGQLIVKVQNMLDKAVNNNLASADKTESGLIKNDLDNPSFTQTGWLTAASWFNKVVSVYAKRSAAMYNSMPVLLKPELASRATDTETGGGAIHSILDDSAKAYERYTGSIDGIIDSRDSAAFSGTTDTTGAGGLSRVDLSEDPENFLKTAIKSGFVTAGLGALNVIGRMANVWDSDGQLMLKFGSTLNPIGELAAFGHTNLNAGLTLLNWGAVSKTAAAFADGSWVVKTFTLGASKALGFVLDAIGTFCFTLAGVLLGIGFTLSYIVPLYPFYRFFFGSIIWIISVFEMIVLAPLFALAHVNPYGEGLAGNYNKYGYQVFFQVLLRPMLMIFGLIAGYLIFAVALHFLNDAFMIAANGTGAEAGGINVRIIGRLAFLVIYCVLIFILANQAFSAIGLFPQAALKWFGMNGVQEERIDTQHLGIAAAYMGKELLGSKLPGAMGAPAAAIGADRKQKAADEKARAGMISDRKFQSSNAGKKYNQETGLAEDIGGGGGQNSSISQGQSNFTPGGMPTLSGDTGSGGSSGGTGSGGSGRGSGSGGSGGGGTGGGTGGTDGGYSRMESSGLSQGSQDFAMGQTTPTLGAGGGSDSGSNSGGSMASVGGDGGSSDGGGNSGGSAQIDTPTKMADATNESFGIDAHVDHDGMGNAPGAKPAIEPNKVAKTGADKGGDDDDGGFKGGFV